MNLIKGNEEAEEKEYRMYEGRMQRNEDNTTVLHLLLAAAIALAVILGCLMERAQGAVAGATVAQAPARVDIVGDIEYETGMLTVTQLTAATGDVDVLISSNGGYLSVGLAIQNAIRQRTMEGKLTRCYALKAISAAFIIFSACTERVVVPYGSTFMMHYPYLVTPRVTVGNVAEISEELGKMKKGMDNWAHRVFKLQAPLMMKYMEDERMMTGKELCTTFINFCRVSYIFPILEQ